MTSLEDRYASTLLDVQQCRSWSRASDDPLLTVSALGSSRPLARPWPVGKQSRWADWRSGHLTEILRLCLIMSHTG